MEKASLRKHTLGLISEFLVDENFNYQQQISFGILDLINKISDYYEEGTPLFPEIIITNDIEKVMTGVTEVIVDLKKDVSIARIDFKQILKEGAIFSQNGWIIFIEIHNRNVRYGIAQCEITETTLSMFDQVVGLGVQQTGSKIAYLRNVGGKIVEMTGYTGAVRISLNLNDEEGEYNTNIRNLSRLICSDVEENQSKVEKYVEKQLTEALRNSHGALVGIVKNTEIKIEKLKSVLKDGTYLIEPIPFPELINEYEIDQSSNKLRIYASILSNAIYSDGVTILTTDAQLLGFRIFVDIEKKTNPKSKGGARSRAFNQLKSIGVFEGCFFMSQDGQSNYYRK